MRLWPRRKRPLPVAVFIPERTLPAIWPFYGESRARWSPSGSRYSVVNFQGDDYPATVAHELKERRTLHAAHRKAAERLAADIEVLAGLPSEPDYAV